MMGKSNTSQSSFIQKPKELETDPKLDTSPFLLSLTHNQTFFSIKTSPDPASFYSQGSRPQEPNL